MELNNITIMTNVIRMINGFLYPLSDKNILLGDDTE